MRALTNTPFTLAGSAPGAVLLVHGLGGGVYEVQWLAEHLHARLGLTVRAMHLAGHERPSTLMPPSTHDAWLASLRREYDALAAAHRVVHVVGFSTGCLVVLRLAQQHAVSGKLVLLAPFLAVFKPALLPWRPEALLRAFRFLSQVPRRPPPLADRSLRAEVTRVLPFSTMNLDAARSALELAALVEQGLAQVTCPVLSIQGARDTVVDPAGATRLDAALGGEHRLVRLADSDHLVALDREREQLFDEVTGFLS